MRIYSGPGSGPMRAVAAAFGGLSAELHSAALSIDAVVDELTGLGWQGPSAAAMENAAQTYVAWLLATAEQVGQTSAQANAAAAAYDAAFSATVPPSVVAANRARYALLVATNILGQNTAAIAATDTEYYEYWAQDAAAMYTYAASSAAAARLVPFTEPQQNSNPEGLVNQAASTASGQSNSVMNMVTNVLSQLATGQTGSQGLAPAVLAAAPAQAIPGGEIIDFLSNFGLFDIVGAVGGTLGGIGIGVSAGAWTSADAATEEILNEQDQVRTLEYEILHAIDLFSPLTPSRPHAGSTSAWAAMGEAASLGQLSVPSSWTAIAPEIRGMSYSRPLAGPPLPAAPGVAAQMGSAFSQMSLAGMGGSALAGTVSRGRGQATANTAIQQAAKTMQQNPSAPAPAGSGGEKGRAGPKTGVAAEIREFAELRDAGIISDEEFNEQKHRLLSGGQ